MSGRQKLSPSNWFTFQAIKYCSWSEVAGVTDLNMSKVFRHRCPDAGAPAVLDSKKYCVSNSNKGDTRARWRSRIEDAKAGCS